MLLANLAFAAAATLAVSDGTIGDGTDYSRDIGAALKAGCHVQQVHTPAGKPVQSAPIVHCNQQARQALFARASADANTKSRRASD